MSDEDRPTNKEGLPMPKEVHKQHHVRLLAALEELSADYLNQHEGVYNHKMITVSELMDWAVEQSKNPT